MQGLPSDEQSSDSAIIAMHCGRVPLFIDPQRQAEAWLRHKEAARGLRVVSASQPSAVRTVAHCARMGMPCLVTDVAPGLDPALAPLCALADSAVSLEGRKHHTADAPVTVRIGGSDVRVAAGFSLYLATDRAAEEITPTTAMLVAVVEFGVSRGALEEQLLAAVVRHERPSLEAQREALEQSTARDMKALHEHEEQTLHLLQVRRCCRPTAMKLCTRSRVPMHGVHACMHMQFVADQRCGRMWLLVWTSLLEAHTCMQLPDRRMRTCLEAHVPVLGCRPIIKMAVTIWEDLAVWSQGRSRRLLSVCKGFVVPTQQTRGRHAAGL